MSDEKLEELKDKLLIVLFERLGAGDEIVIMPAEIKEAEAKSLSLKINTENKSMTFKVKKLKVH